MECAQIMFWRYENIKSTTKTERRTQGKGNKKLVEISRKFYQIVGTTLQRVNFQLFYLINCLQLKGWFFSLSGNQALRRYVIDDSKICDVSYLCKSNNCHNGDESDCDNELQCAFQK